MHRIHVCITLTVGSYVLYLLEFQSSLGHFGHFLVSDPVSQPSRSTDPPKKDHTRRSKLEIFRSTLRKQQNTSTSSSNESFSGGREGDTKQHWSSGASKKYKFYFFITKVRDANKSQIREHLLHELGGDARVESLVVATSPSLLEANPDQPYEDYNRNDNDIDLHLYFHLKVRCFTICSGK